MFKIIALAAVIVPAFAFAPVQAATEQECEQAVDRTQNDMQDNAGVMMERNSMQEEWGERLERASGYGAEGNPAKCLEVVKGLRGEMGLEPL